MTDAGIVLRRLVLIEQQVAWLRTAAVERLETDTRELLAVQHSLQIAIQAALDCATHIVAERHLGEPPTYSRLFDPLVGDGWLRPEQVPSLRSMAGFRNILVHGYADVDLGVVRDVLRNRLTDLLGFVASVRERLRREPPAGPSTS